MFAIDGHPSDTIIWRKMCSIPKIQILKFSQTRSKFKMNFKISFQNVCLLVDINK
jgi:hypothetical protein